MKRHGLDHDRGRRVIMRNTPTKRNGMFLKREISGIGLAVGAVVLLANSGTAWAQIPQNGGFMPVNQTNPSGVNWLQQGGNATHDHNNFAESTISTATVGTLKPYGSQATLVTPCGPGNISTSPVVANGTAFINCGGNLATFAWPAGSPVGISKATGASNNIGTPAIDPSLQYVYNVGTDGCVHKYPINVSQSNNLEYTGPGGGSLTGYVSGCFSATGGGWPEPFTANPANESVVTALTIGTIPGPGDESQTSYLYVAVDSIGQGSNWIGNVTTINLNTGMETVFNVLCSNLANHILSKGCQGGIEGGSNWSRGGIPYDYATQRLFFGTSEIASGGSTTVFSGNVSPFNWGESVVALNPPGGGPPVDWFSPTDGGPAGPTSSQNLSGLDDDGGSSNPLIIRVPASYQSNYSELLVWVGKEGVVHLINPMVMNTTTSLVGTVNTGQISYYTLPYPDGNGNYGEVTAPISQWSSVAGTWIFLPLSNSYGAGGTTVLVGLALVVPPRGVGSGQPFFSQGWQNTKTGAWSGTFVANGVLYAALNTSSSSTLYAFDPATGSQLWSSTPFGALAAPYDKRQTPLVVNGALYYSGRVFTLNGAAPPTFSN
jgi:hypothetical protein